MEDHGGVLKWGDPQIIPNWIILALQTHGFRDPQFEETPIYPIVQGNNLMQHHFYHIQHCPVAESQVVSLSPATKRSSEEVCSL